ncbi:MAG: leucine-rich repeat protein, partial [Paludibacteraceae bacterium]|nr:leucine-rich repeat protein [Paludibacteraceae bacterium]
MTDKAIQNYSIEMFYGCSKLVGGAGTKCKGGNATYAHIDGGPSNPGYLTEYKPIPYALILRNTKQGHQDDYKQNIHLGYDTLVIKYGIPEENEETFPISCEGMEWWENNIDSFMYWSTIYIDTSFRAFPLKSTCYMFSRMSNASKIIGLQNLNINSVIDMSCMFRESHFSELDLRGLNTRNVKYMEMMFYNSKKLNRLYLDDLDTRNVVSMNRMFSGCSELKTLDLSSFDTRKVKDMYLMFEDCHKLETIYVREHWSKISLSDEDSDMFRYNQFGCPNLVGGAGTKWASTATSAMYAHIDGGEENPGYFTMAKVDTFYIDGLKYIITYKGSHEASVGYADLAGDTIVIPEKVQIDGTDYTVTGIMDEGFINQYKLKSVVIPESVTEIGEKAFYGNHNIISLDIPSSVTSIGASAFSSILNVNYAGDAEGSPWGANVCNGEVDFDLKFVFSDSTRTKIVRYFGKDSIVVIPNSVKELGESSFTKAIEMKHVELNNVEKID